MTPIWNDETRVGRARAAVRRGIAELNLLLHYLDIMPLLGAHQSWVGNWLVVLVLTGRMLVRDAAVSRAGALLGGINSRL